ncbi:hypothetical protein [Jhaorihella thermophila]|uniref:hypothetical protein n=1 Tax=Jhaorihella thermophila TaxID=488547 RepID=UPI00361EC250
MATNNNAPSGIEVSCSKAADSCMGNAARADCSTSSVDRRTISDSFEAKHAELMAEIPSRAPEDRDEYLADNIFWVPKEARWSHLQVARNSPGHRH